MSKIVIKVIGDPNSSGLSQCPWEVHGISDDLRWNYKLYTNSIDQGKEFNLPVMIIVIFQLPLGSSHVIKQDSMYTVVDKKVFTWVFLLYTLRTITPLTQSATSILFFFINFINIVGYVCMSVCLSL